MFTAWVMCPLVGLWHYLIGHLFMLLVSGVISGFLSLGFGIIYDVGVILEILFLVQ